MAYLLMSPGMEERESLELYRSRGGYSGLQRALVQGPGWVLSELGMAGLRGRGGSGQGNLTADKWMRAARAQHRTRYVIANGAESSPVSQKDRFLMSRSPHRVLEGLLAAAITIGAETAYIYIRGDAEDPLASMTAALAEAQEAGIFGPGTPCPVNVLIQQAIPSYVAGEETAVIDALEGLEGRPQPKPPRPEEVGLHGCPTVVTNVETLAAAAAILCFGIERFLAVGTPACPGTALFTVSGDVAAPGVFEVPYGTPLRSLLEMADAPAPEELLAVLPGLSSGPLHPGELDVPLTYEGLAAIGSSLGTAAFLVLRRNGTGFGVIAAEVASFLAEASCGQCRGCKEGHTQLAEVLGVGEKSRAKDLAELLLYGRGNCAHPTGTARFVLRALEVFPTEFDGPHPQPKTV